VYLLKSASSIIICGKLKPLGISFLVRNIKNGLMVLLLLTSIAAA
jgi:hypothetical protein